MLAAFAVGKSFVYICSVKGKGVCCRIKGNLAVVNCICGQNIFCICAGNLCVSHPKLIFCFSAFRLPKGNVVDKSHNIFRRIIFKVKLKLNSISCGLPKVKYFILNFLCAWFNSPMHTGKTARQPYRRNFGSKFSAWVFAVQRPIVKGKIIILTD